MESEEKKEKEKKEECRLDGLLKFGGGGRKEGGLQYQCLHIFTWK